MKNLENLEAARQTFILRNTWASSRSSASANQAYERFVDSIKLHKSYAQKDYYKLPEKEICRCCNTRYKTEANAYYHAISAEHIANLYDVDPEAVLEAQAAVDMIKKLAGMHS